MTVPLGIVISLNAPLVFTTPLVAEYPMTARPPELSNVPSELTWKFPLRVYNWLPLLSSTKNPAPSIATSLVEEAEDIDPVVKSVVFVATCTPLPA
jgi:hypothetical protein